MELEASLFATIFSDAVESVSILSRGPQSSSQAASLASSLENAGFSAAASAVEALADAESRFRESVRASGSRRGAAVGTAGDDGTVREAARALARALRARPAAAALVGSGAAGSARMNEFAVTLRALGGAAVARLRTSRTIQDEERAAARHGAERVAQAEAESTRLSAALTAARAADAAEIAEADRLLARVTAELASVHVGAESALKEVKAAASSRLGTVEGKLLAAESASAAMKDKLAAELRAAVDANAEAEAALRKRKTRCVPFRRSRAASTILQCIPRHPTPTPAPAPIPLPTKSAR